MKGRKKARAWRRLSALFLALMLTTTLISPVSLKAEEPDGKDSVQTQDSGQIHDDAKQDVGQNQDDSEKKEDVPADDSKQNETQTGDNAGEKDQTMPDADKTDAGNGTADGNATDNAAGDIANDLQGEVQTAAGEPGYDVTPPVIESFEFAENGKTVEPGDTLHFSMRTYDAQSGIGSVYVDFYEKAGNGINVNSGRVDLVKSADDDNLYMAEYQVNSLYGTDYVISNIRSVDKNSNYADVKVNNDSYNPIYTFKINRTSLSGPEIKNVKMTNQGKTLRKGDTVKVSAEVTAENGLSDEYSSVQACFTTMKGNISHNAWQTLYKITGNTYETTFNVTDTTYPGKWELSVIEARDTKGYVSQNTPVDLYFNVEQDNFDTSAPRIKKISLDQQGQILSPGDKVTVTVEAQDDVALEEYGYVYFYAAADKVADSHQTVNLTYDKAAKAYKGVFEILEDTYPCEWYVGSLTILDTSGNEANLYDYDLSYNSRYPDYFRVINQGTSVEQTGSATVVFSATDKNGLRKEISRKTYEKVPRREKLGKLVGEFPDVSALETYEGIKFKGWVDINGNPLNADTEILTANSGSWYNIYAAYDRNPIQLNYSYLNADGYQNMVSDVLLADEGATYREVAEQAEKRAKPDSGYDGMKFTGWKCMYLPDNKDLPVPPGRSITIHAQYEKSLANITLSYVNKKGELVYDTVQRQFDNGTKLGEVLKQMDKEGPPESYAGLKFGGWDCSGNVNQEITSGEYISMDAIYEGKTIVKSSYSYWDAEGKSKIEESTKIIDDGKVDTAKMLEEAKSQKAPESYKELRFHNWQGSINASASGRIIRIYLQAQYENCLFRVILDDRFSKPSGSSDDQNYDYMDVKVVEKNSTAKVPAVVEGYKKVTWVNSWQYTDDITKPFTVDRDVSLMGYGDKGETPKPNPDPTPDPKPDPTPTPDPAPTPTPTPPGVSLPKEEIVQHVTEIRDVQPGSQVVVPMTNNATVVPVEILEAAKGKDVDVVLEMDGYSWTINGQDIQSSNLKDINLEVKVDADVIPGSLIQKLAGGKPVRQLSLTHNGDFGFKADLNINLGSQYAGQYGNLYYYDSSGKMVFMNAGEISADGNASLAFSHASEYAVVIGEYMGNSTPEVSLDQNGNSFGSGSPRTGDHVPVAPLAVAFAVALAVIVYSFKKRGTVN